MTDQEWKEMRQQLRVEQRGKLDILRNYVENMEKVLKSTQEAIREGSNRGVFWHEIADQNIDDILGKS